MNNYWPFLIIPLISAAALLAGTPAIGQEASGTITGVVFDDFDGDGAQDEGEPALVDRIVSISSAGGFLSDQLSAPDGGYVFSYLVPGGYVVAVDPDQSSGICLELPLDGITFNPTAISFCVDLVHPFRATTPSSVGVTVVDGETAQVNFGLQPVDVVTMAGYAILEGGFAPPGTVIEARFEGMECGRAEARGGSLNLQIDVFGAGERSGCPERDDLVNFLIDGLATNGEVRWVPFTETLDAGGFLHIGIIAMERHAWYWTQPVVDVPPPDGTVVQAVVGGVVCGEATTRAFPIGQGSLQHIVGFSRLIVPPAEPASGCGRPGATVSFQMAGEEVGTVAWEPGLQEVYLDLADAFAPSLPRTGSGGSASAWLFWLWLVALGTIGFLALGAGVVGLRRRFP